MITMVRQCMPVAADSFSCALAATHRPCRLSQSLASLSDFYEDSWLSVRISVWWRCCTIVTGVVISTLVCMLVLPVFAGDVARAALADVLRTAAELLGGVVELYLVVRHALGSFAD